MLILSATLPNVSAQSNTTDVTSASVQVWTDKASYTAGEKVLVNVSVQPVQDDTIAITILSSAGTVWSQTSLSPDQNGNAQYSFALTSSAPTGMWTVAVTYLKVRAQASFSVSETQAQPTPVKQLDFSISCSPSSLNVQQGTSANSSCTIQSLNGFNSAVWLSCSGQPNGVSCDFRPNPVTPQADGSISSILNILAPVEAVIGRYDIVIIAEAPDVALRNDFVLNVSIFQGKAVETKLLAITDKKIYTADDNVFLMIMNADPNSSLTVLVLDPEEDVYLEEEVTVGSNGAALLSFRLWDAKPGQWSVQVATGETIHESLFKVSGIREILGIEGVATIKNLKKTTLVSIKNTGHADISSLLIQVNEGSMQFVKAKNWEVKRIGDNTVELTTSKPLKQNHSMRVILKWNDRPEIQRVMKISIGSVDLEKPGSCEGHTEPLLICIGFAGMKSVHAEKRGPDYTKYVPSWYVHIEREGPSHTKYLPSDFKHAEKKGPDFSAFVWPDWKHIEGEGRSQTKYLPPHYKHAEKKGPDYTEYLPGDYWHDERGNPSSYVPAGAKHAEKQGRDFSKYFMEEWKHIETIEGLKSIYQPPDKLMHAEKRGPHHSTYVFPDFKHADKEGPDYTKYVPPYYVHYELPRHIYASTRIIEGSSYDR